MYINAISFYRVGKYLRANHIPILPRFFSCLIFVLFNSSIPLTAQIGQGTRCSHRGIAVVIHRNAKIGNDCVIGAQVVIGGGGKGKPGAPVIGNKVYIGVGAKVIGDVNIGDNVVIGANAVVNCDIPSGATVGGIPAQQLSSSQERTETDED